MTSFDCWPTSSTWTLELRAPRKEAPLLRSAKRRFQMATSLESARPRARSCVCGGKRAMFALLWFSARRKFERGNNPIRAEVRSSAAKISRPPLRYKINPTLLALATLAIFQVLLAGQIQLSSTVLARSLQLEATSNQTHFKVSSLTSANETQTASSILERRAGQNEPTLVLQRAPSRSEKEEALQANELKTEPAANVNGAKLADNNNNNNNQTNTNEYEEELLDDDELTDAGEEQREIRIQTSAQLSAKLLRQMEAQRRRFARNSALLRELKRRRAPFQLFVPEERRVGRRRKRSASPGQQRASSQAKTTTTTTSTTMNNASQHAPASNKANQASVYRTNVVIKAFNYKLRLDLELNNILFGPSLVQKHILPKGAQLFPTQKIEHCYYHAKTQSETRPAAIGAFRTCNGLSGIIHVNNESFVIHPFYEAESSKKHPHIIYRYQADNQAGAVVGAGEQQREAANWRQCPTTRLHEWAYRKYNKLAPQLNLSPQSAAANAAGSQAQFKRESSLAATHEASLLSASNGCAKGDELCDKNNKPPGGEKELALEQLHAASLISKLSKRDVSLTEKYIELALVLSQDLFDKRNSSSRSEVLHDAIQIINCLDLYLRSANTRVALIYVETWAHGDQIELSSDVKQTLYNFLEYSKRKLYKISWDAAHLLTGGHARQFDYHEMGMAYPDSICSSQAVGVSQEASIFEPFIAASTMAHMLGHNLGMEHDTPRPAASSDLAPADASDLVSEPSASSLAPLAERVSAGPQVWRARPAPHSSATSSDPEEHDDEIRGRSVHDGDGQSRAQRNSLFDLDPDEEHCTSNCLMSERFLNPQPPVSIGNMIQQQVASNQSMLALFSAATGAMQADSAAIVAMDQQGSVSSLNQLANEQQETLAQLESSQQQQNRWPMAASLPFRFSRQSLETYHKLLLLGQGICLFNKPNQLEDFKTCGNGIVDKDEDCDCGRLQDCYLNDPCCDPITCRFKADAECINGACCDRCRLRPKGFVCRKSRNECDLAEQCDGKSSQCAPDVHKQNGFPCAQGQGYCYLGQCPLHDAQCAELWGSDARRSSELCFLTFNSNGSVRGNCGFEPHSYTYKRCERHSLMCGTLQCQAGDMKPVTAQLEPQRNNAQEFSKKILRDSQGQSHECKVIVGTPAQSSYGGIQSASSLSLVRDGTKCEPNKICFNQTCQPLELVFRDAYELCPRDEAGHFCSKNGVCSTANRCQCAPNWTGHDCSQRVTLNDTLIQAPTRAHLINETQTTSSSADQVAGSSVGLQQMRFQESSQRNASAGLLFEGRLAQISSPANAFQSKPPAEEPSTTTVPSSSTTTPTSNANVSATAPASTTALVVADRKKHDALGAPTLVLILVSIVAAVYLGFALMANCYRRKGFIKPDKVLRHHQLNCKLDAIRSSFIARRLADAEAAGTFEGTPQANNNSGNNNNNNNGSSETTTTNPSLALMGANQDSFMSPGTQPKLLLDNCGQVQNFQQQQQQLANNYGSGLLEPSVSFEQSSLMKPNLNSTLFEPRQRQQQRLANQQFAAELHYFEEQRGPPSHGCIHQQRAQAAAAAQQLELAYEPSNEQLTADHIPLLLAANEPSARRALNQGIMRSFGQQQANSQQQQKAPPRPLGAFAGQSRATSLGDVNRKQTLARQELEQLEDEQEARSIAQRALATPLRINPNALVSPRANRHSQTLTAPADDYCSAPSSPEPRDACWSESERPRTHRHQSVSSALSRQASAVRLAAALSSSNLRAQQQVGGYHEEAIFDALSAANSKSVQARQRRSLGSQQAKAPHLVWQQHSMEQSASRNFEQSADLEEARDYEQELPPLPPPPPPLPAHLAERSVMSGEEGVEADLDEEDADSEPLLASIQSHQHQQRAGLSQQKQLQFGQPSSSRSPQSYAQSTARSVRRVPLNDGSNEPANSQAAFEQLSLIGQLQQLERVQSLHQKHIDQSSSLKRSSGLNVAEGANMHEFFSLPLSVQLSALLARSLRDDLSESCGMITQLSVEDYLNTLNNSSVAASSRRSFRRSSQNVSKEQLQAPQQADNWGKRQQMKIQNLQSLINRLQKLHNQTVLQQQLDELNGELEDDMLRNSRQSTLSRAGRSRIVARAKQEAADDLFATNSLAKHQQPQLQRTDSSQEGGAYASCPRHRKSASRSASGACSNKNDSIYSMSDSEDGALVSRVLVSYQRKIEARTNSACKSTEENLNSDVSQEHNQENLQQQAAPPPFAASSPPPPPASNAAPQDKAEDVEQASGEVEEGAAPGSQ